MLLATRGEGAETRTRRRRARASRQAPPKVREAAAQRNTALRSWTSFSLVVFHGRPTAQRPLPTPAAQSTTHRPAQLITRAHSPTRMLA